MKICAACSQTLSKDNFSKKQWQLTQKRRCKECIADNREVDPEALNNEVPPPLTDGEVTPCWTDEDLFKQPPPNDECPICMLTLPLEAQMSQYQECCGKIICMGCSHADDMRDDRCLCPFCRAPSVTSEGEHIKMVEKRVASGDVNAMRNLACHYSRGDMGLPQNTKRQ